MDAVERSRKVVYIEMSMSHWITLLQGYKELLDFFFVIRD